MSWHFRAPAVEFLSGLCKFNRRLKGSVVPVEVDSSVLVCGHSSPFLGQILSVLAELGHSSPPTGQFYLVAYPGPSLLTSCPGLKHENKETERTSGLEGSNYLSYLVAVALGSRINHLGLVNSQRPADHWYGLLWCDAG